MSMPKGQRVRQLGKNMKPRETGEIAAEVENQPSTDEGPEGSEEIADSEPLSEVENVGGQSEETSQNGLLQENAVSSQESAPERDSLSELLKRSEVLTETTQTAIRTAVEEARKPIEERLQILDPSDGLGLVRRQMSQAELEARFPMHVVYRDATVRESQLADLGELSTGEYRTTVRIPEGYIAGIEDQAKADNMTLEDWVSMRFADYIQQWFFSSGQK